MKRHLIISIFFVLKIATLHGQGVINHSKSNIFDGYEGDLSSAISAFESQTGISVEVITSYGYDTELFFTYANNWSGNGIFIGINPTDGDWSQNLIVKYGSDVLQVEPLTAPSIDAVISNIMIPILSEQSIAISDMTGSSVEASFASGTKYYKCIEIGLSEMLKGSMPLETESNQEDSGGSNRGPFEEGEIQIGPLTMTLAATPESTSTDADGYCSYENIGIDLELNLANELHGDYSFSLPNATISLKHHCENHDFKDVSISWENPDGVFIGKVGFIDANATAANLQIDAEGNLSGSVSFNGSLSEDVVIQQIFVIKSGLSGDFSFAFSGGEDFSGDFEFSGLENLNIEMNKSSQRLGVMANATYSGDGRITGRFGLANGPVSFSNQSFTTTITALDIDATYAESDGFQLTGSSTLEITEISGMQGEIGTTLDYQNGNIMATITTSNLQTFGMEVSEASLTGQFNETFDLQEISGNFEISHTEFNAALNVQSFSFTNEGLQVFSATGSVSYDGSELILQECVYQPDNNLISFDALAKVTVQGVEATAAVSSFTIDFEGNIKMGEITEATADVVLGPILVNFEGNTSQSNDGRDANGERIKQIEGNATIQVKTISASGQETFREISEVDVTYRKLRDTGTILSGDLTWEGSSAFGDILGISTTLKELDLHVDDEANLTGGLELNVALTENKSIRDIFILKSGLQGTIAYTYNGGESYEGNFDFSGITGIGLVIKKGNQELAELRNASFSNNSVLSGTIEALDNATYTSNSFTLKIQELSLSASYAFEENELTINSGTGKAIVSNITGADGQIALSLEYGVDENFEATASLDGEFSIAGMVVSDPILNAQFDQNFDLTEISGSIKISHEQIESAISIESVLIQNGQLQSLNGSGQFAYKGFDFKLESLAYTNSSLSLNANLALNTTGVETHFGVEDFVINKTGNISVGEVSGDLRKGNHIELAFVVQMQAERFHGTFTGKLKSIGVGINGEIDFGKEQDYNFAYLALSAQSNILIGATGLKITEMGGQIGYNYKLTYNSSNGSFTGAPDKGNYLLGFTLGIADVAGMVEVVGNPIVQFSSSTFDMSFTGTLSITQNNPMLSSQLSANYSLPSNNLSGSVTSDLKVPQGTGKIFRAHAAVDFGMANNNWFLNGHNISGTLLSAVDFDGSFSVDGRTSPFILNQFQLTGQAHMSYSLDYTMQVLDTDLELYVHGSANFNSYVNVSLDQSGLQGEVSVNLGVTAAVGASYGGVSYDLVAASGSLTGAMGYSNNRGYIEGELEYKVEILYMEWDVPLEVDYEFENT